MGAINGGAINGGAINGGAINGGTLADSPAIEAGVAILDGLLCSVIGSPSGAGVCLAASVSVGTVIGVPAGASAASLGAASQVAYLGDLQAGGVSVVPPIADTVIGVPAGASSSVVSGIRATTLGTISGASEAAVNGFLAGVLGESLLSGSSTALPSSILPVGIGGLDGIVQAATPFALAPAARMGTPTVSRSIRC